VTVWERLKAWWAKPVSDEEEDLPEQRRDALIEWTAQQARRFGLITPTYIFAEMNRPLMFVYSQFVHFLSPFADTFLGGRAQEVGYLMQDTKNLDRFLARLEELGRQENEAGQAARPAASPHRRPQDPS
jgi:hypothetical protein